MKINYKNIIVSDKPGWKICNVDLVSAEMLTLALICECPSMLDMLSNGEDLHNKVACIAFNTTPDKVTKQQRNASKVVNYLTNYGGSSWILQQSIIKSVGLDLPEEECQRIMDARFEVWPEIPAWWESTFKKLEEGIFLTNLTGRCKPFFARRWEERRGQLVRNAKLEKNARAWVNQSTVADITKLAQIRLCQKEVETKGELFNFLLEVHDSLTVQYKPGHEKEIHAIMQECFDIELDAGWTKYTIPISMEVGPNYGEVKEYKI